MSFFAPKFPSFMNCQTGFELFTKMDNFRIGLGKRVVYALKSGDYYFSSLSLCLSFFCGF